MTAPVTSSPANDVSAIVDDVVSASIKQSLSEQTPALKPPRDERGKFAKPQSATPATPTAETETFDTTAETPSEPQSANPDTEAEPVVLPEGMVAVPTINRELATTFTVADAEGAIEPPDLTIEFTANGKTRREPLDKVVKLAQWGVYNHERQQQSEQIAQENEALQSHLAQYEAAVQQLRAEREALLSNDEAYLTARAQFEAQNTPEARLRAQQEAVLAERHQMQFEQAQQVGTQFLDTKIEPALDLIVSALPTVSREELAARVLLVCNKYAVATPFGTIINPRAHGAIAEAIKAEVVPWAQQVHDERESAKAGDSSRTQALQVEAQRAKNLAARSMRSVGSATSARKAPVIRTADDAVNAAISAALQSVGVER